MNNSVAVIVLQYNNFPNTKDFLESLFDIDYQNFDVIIVDNKSSDNSLNDLQKHLQNTNQQFAYVEYRDKEFDYLHKKREKITIISSDFNGGYPYGMNLGAKYAFFKKYDFYLKINNDTIVQRDFLEPLIKLSLSDRKIGLLSSKIYYHNTKNRIWYIGGELSPITFKAKHFDFGEKDNNQNYDNISFLSGCTHFLRHDALDDVGFYDDSMFFYGDDTDYSIRFKNKGYDLLVCHDSIVFHKKDLNGEEITEFFQLNKSRSKRKIINKHAKGLNWFLAYLYNVFYDLFRSVYYRKFNLLKAHVRGLLLK